MRFTLRRVGAGLGLAVLWALIAGCGGDGGGDTPDAAAPDASRASR